MELIKDGKALENLFKEDDRKSQEILPELIEKLIKASCGKDVKTRFPHGSAIYTPGFDGITSNTRKNGEFVPKGKTIWELGTKEGAEGKIESDYEKRKANPKTKDKKSKNYVAVTSRIIDSSSKVTIEEEYTAEKVFKSVKVLDANDLARWLSANIEISIWLLKKFGQRISEYSIKLLSDEWDFITSSTQPNLPAELFLCGNQSKAKQFIDDINNSNVGTFSFSSEFYGRDFAYYFIVAALIDSSNESIINKCVVVKNQDALYAINSMCEGKIVIVDCDIDSNFSEKLINNIYVFFGNPLYTTVSLEMTDKNNFLSILKDIGFSDGEAEKHSFLCDRNPVTLRRLLSNIPSVREPSWTKKKEKYQMIPLMLVGELDMDSQASVEILKILFNSGYDNFLYSLNYLSEIDCPPVFKFRHLYKNGCRKECFDFVKVDTFLDIVSKFEDILKKLLLEPSIFGNNARIDRIINNIIQGFILITEKSANNQYHFDNYLYNLLCDVFDDVQKTTAIAKYFDSLAELSPLGFLRYIQKGITNHKEYLVKLCDKKETDWFGSTKEITSYLINGLRECLCKKELAFESFECLLNIYFEINKGEAMENAIKELLSPIASMTGVTAIPFLSKVKYFFDYINNKNFDTETIEPIVKTLYSNGNDSIWVASGRTYRNNELETLNCTFQEIFDAHSIAFEWLMKNSKNKENGLDALFINIHHIPYQQMEKEFSALIKEIGAMSKEQKEHIRIKAIETKGNIQRFKSWQTLDNYIPLLDELIKASEPSELFEKYLYILTNDFFPLENPPKESERDYEIEQGIRTDKRKEIIDELLAAYGQDIIQDIIKQCGDKSYYIWETIYLVSDNRLRDVQNMINLKCEKGLRCYFSHFDTDNIKNIIKEYSNINLVFRVLPFNKEIMAIIDGNKNEESYWLDKYYYGERVVAFSDVFDKFLKFNPFGILAEMAYHQDIVLEQGLAVLNRIGELLSNKKETENIRKELYDIQKIVERMDSKYNSDELAKCEFNLLPLLIGNLRDYPLGIKKYFWANPLDFADLLISLQKDKKLRSKDSAGEKLFIDALFTFGDKCFIPKEYLVQRSDEVREWVSKMLSKYDSKTNDDVKHLIVHAVIGVLSSCPKVPGQDVWPTIEVADSLEKIAKIDGMSSHEVSSSFATAVLNRRGVRTITNGSAEFALSDDYLRCALIYEKTHPVTYLAVKIISSDIRRDGERDKTNYELDTFN